MTKVTCYMYSYDTCCKIREMMEMDGLDCAKYQKSRRRNMVRIKRIVNNNKTKLVNRFLPHLSQKTCSVLEVMQWAGILIF